MVNLEKGVRIRDDKGHDHCKPQRFTRDNYIQKAAKA